MSSITYTDEQLEALLADIESDLVERKESWRGDASEKGRQAVCAFANDLPDHQRPGVLFVGTRDDGTPSGLAITDELLRTLSDIRSDGNILPLPLVGSGATAREMTKRFRRESRRVNSLLRVSVPTLTI